MIRRLGRIVCWIEKILLLRDWHDYPEPKAIANPPPWDVPLDQTTAPIHYEGDVTSV
jgi:predicted membrane-bound dolichyl-phosphate-mannose-protein mannosyltransferase